MARQLWNTRNGFLSATQTPRSKPLLTTMSRQGGRAFHRNSVNAPSDKGLKCQFWKNILHQVLKDEFSRLQSVGTKIETEFLPQTTILLI